MSCKQTADGKIVGTTDGMEYSGDGGKTWRPASGSPTLVPAGTYLVRTRATVDAPHGRPAEVTVGSADPGAAVPAATVTAHVQKKGWPAAASGGAVAGTTGQRCRFEALTIKVAGTDVSGGIEYRSHLRGTGWERSWRRDGKRSGTTGQKRRAEAVQVVIVPKGDPAPPKTYQGAIQTYGKACHPWQDHLWAERSTR